MRSPAPPRRPALQALTPASSLAALVLLLALAHPAAARAGDAADCARFHEPACRRLAESGDLPAQLRLAAMYEVGWSVTRDLGQARAWYRRAAAQGSDFARDREGALAQQAGGGGREPEILAVSHPIPRAAHRDALAPAHLARPGPVPRLPRVVVPWPDGPRLALRTDIAYLPKWQRVRDWIRDDAQAAGDPALAAWAAWAASLRNLPPAGRLRAINSRVNASFRYETDIKVWGRRNYWVTPAEAVAKGRTDCKGFAVMKLWLARLAGVEERDLRLLVGFLPTRELHAVASITTDGTAHVLDSRGSGSIDPGAMPAFKPVLIADFRELYLVIGTPAEDR